MQKCKKPIACAVFGGFSGALVALDCLLCLLCACFAGVFSRCVEVARVSVRRGLQGFGSAWAVVGLA